MKNLAIFLAMTIWINFDFSLVKVTIFSKKSSSPIILLPITHMLELVKQTVDFYFKHLKAPVIADMQPIDPKVFEEKGSCFVTIYKNGEIRGSAGNVKEIEPSIWEEVIKNTIEAISKDSRFAPLTLAEVKDIRVRLDVIEDRHILDEGKLFSIDPMKYGAIAIKKNYSKLAVVLPNISPKLLTWADLLAALEAKLWEKLMEADYILYQIQTKTDRNY